MQCTGTLCCCKISLLTHVKADTPQNAPTASANLLLMNLAPACSSAWAYFLPDKGRGISLCWTSWGACVWLSWSLMNISESTMKINRIWTRAVPYQSLKDDMHNQTPTGLAAIDCGSLCPSVWPVFQPHNNCPIQSISPQFSYKDAVRDSIESFLESRSTAFSSLTKPDIS